MKQKKTRNSVPPRERILEAAALMFYEDGIRGVGVEAIAAAADTTKMAIYRNFDSKDELVAEWVRGLPAEAFPAEGRSFSSEGRLRTFEQAGWRIDYLEWFESTGGQPVMPLRIEASRGTAKVRLIVDRWSLAAP